MRKFNNDKPIESDQDLFDRACERLLEHFDWGICGEGDGTCYYRAVETSGEMNCCVVGYVIPDWPDIMPDATLNDEDVTTLLVSGEEPKVWFKGVATQALLSELQTVHDSIEVWHNVEIMADDLWALAKPRGLNFDRWTGYLSKKA